MIVIKYFDGENKLIAEQRISLSFSDLNQYLNFWVVKFAAKKFSVHDDTSNMFILKAV